MPPLADSSVPEGLSRLWIDAVLGDAGGQNAARHATAHDQQKKTVSLSFLGNGKRTVRVGYVTESPMWKTSYRLALSGDKAFLQGWAIVEHTTDEDYGSDEEFSEGREFERRHKLRERNQAAVTAAKNSFREKHGKLFCQVCGFDFLDRYGELGRDFIEAHHTIPVSTFKGQIKTKLSDIALVCANCHRMLHKRRPWLEMKDLERLIENRDDVPGDA